MDQLLGGGGGGGGGEDDDYRCNVVVSVGAFVHV